MKFHVDLFVDQSLRLSVEVGPDLGDGHFGFLFLSEKWGKIGSNYTFSAGLCSTIWSLNNALCDLLEVRSTADERQFSITKWCRRNKESLSCSLVPLLASLQVSRLRRTTGKVYSFAKKPPPLRSRLQLPSTIAMDKLQLI